MIVFPLIRLVGLKTAMASSRVVMLPMFVRNRPYRTRWTILVSLARSGTRTKSIAAVQAWAVERAAVARLKPAPGLIRSFFRAPSVAYITG